MKILIVLLVFYGVVIITLYFIQDRMLYFPEKSIWQTPKEIGLEYEEFYLKTKDGITISGWYIPKKDEKGVILFCHGNAGNISHRLDSIKIFNDLGLTVLIFDYRGYGKSNGELSEEGTYLDAEAVWDYLIDIKQKSPDKIFLFGRSLGAAIATEIALRKNPAGLIIESSFTSVPEIAKKYYPWIPVGLLSKYHYSTIDKIRLIKCPKLVIHSPDDEIVPFKHGRLLYENAFEPKEFLEIKGKHNDGFIFSGDLYREGLRKFIDKIIS